MAVNSAGSNYAQITGLPFTKATGELPQGSVYFNYVTFPTNTVHVTFSPVTTSERATWYFASIRDGTASANVDISGFNNSSSLYFSATYRTTT
jgi:hypothetical protein